VTLRPLAGRNIRRLLVALSLIAVLALVAIEIGPARRGAALGPVIALTPNEVTDNGFVGSVWDPVMSFRGEVAGVVDREVREVAFIQLDEPGPDQMFGAYGITVSGDGCVALTTAQRPVSLAVIIDWFIIDRCSSTSRRLFGVGSAYDRNNSIALSHDGRYAAVQVHNTDDVGVPSWVRRIDTQTLDFVDMVIPAPYDETLAVHGIDISDDGRYIVVPVNDFGNNRIEIAVWDAATGAVDVISDTGPAFQSWAAFPSISGDAQWVSFASNRARGLGEDGARGPWVYVANRATGSARLVSGASSASYYSSLSRDGSQVAFSVADPPIIIVLPTITIGPIVTIPPPASVIPFAPVLRGNGPGCDYLFEPITRIVSDCPATRVNVAFGASPGFTGSFQVETVSLDANNRRVGNHWEPALSGNGRWVSWVSNVGDNLLGTSGGLNGAQHAFTRRRDPGLSVSTVDFGTVAVGSNPPDRTALVRNTGRTSVSVDSIVSPSSPFSLQGGSCGIGDLVPPGATCTIRVRFRPGNAVGSWNDTVTVREIGYDAIQATGRILGGSTTGPTVPPSITTPEDDVILTATPNPADFGSIDVGAASTPLEIAVTNIGNGTGTIGTFLEGSHPDDYFVQTNNCADATLGPGEFCTMDVIFIPGADGLRSAELSARTTGSSVEIPLTGDGVAAPQLTATPNPADFGPVKVGFSSDDITVTVTNTGNGAGLINTTLTGPHRDDYFVRVNNCVNETLQPGASCTMDVALFARAGGVRNATLTASTEGSSVDVRLIGTGRFEPELRASPEAVTQRGITILIGQGFPAGDPITIELNDLDGTNIETFTPTPDADGMFRIPKSAMDMDLGPYTLHVDGIPNTYDPIDEPLVVVLPTFQPQGPTGPAFSTNLLVTRG
jgi:hypothetical protein